MPKEATAVLRPDVLRDVLTLAEVERPLWPSLSETARTEGLVNDGTGTQTPEAPEGAPAGTPETPAAPASGAPATEPPEGGGSPSESPDTDWKQRYEDLRPEADRRQSLIDDIEGRNGPERQAEALEQYAGVELDDAELGPEEEDEFDLRDPNQEIDEIRQELAARDEQAEDAQFQRLEQDYIESTVEQLEGKENLELSDAEYELVVNYGLANRDERDGKPDLEGGMAALKASHEAAHKRYAKSKETFVPPVGTAGEPKVDLKDKDARQKLGREAFEAAERAAQNP